MNTFIQHAANAVAALVTGEGFVASLVESGVVTDGDAYVQAVNDFVAEQVKVFKEAEEAEEVEEEKPVAKPAAKPAAKPKAKAEAKPAAKPKATAAKPKADAKPAKAKAEAAKPAPAAPVEAKVYIVNNAVAKKNTLLVPEGLDLSDAMTCVDNAKLVKVVSAKCQGYHFAAAHLKAVKEALDTLGYVVVETNVEGFLSASSEASAKPAAKPSAKPAAKPKAVAKPVEEEATVEDPAEDEGDVDEDEDNEEEFAPAEDAEDEDEDAEDEEAVESDVEEDEGEEAEDAEDGEEDEEGEEGGVNLTIEEDDNGTFVGEVGGKVYAWVELVDEEQTCVGRMDDKATTKVKGFIGCVPLTAADKKIVDGYRVLTKEDAKHFTPAQVKALKAGKFL